VTERAYVFDACVLKIRDGDTIEVDIDLGLYAHLRAALSLKDLDTPEIVGVSSARGLEARAELAALIPVGTMVRIQTFRRPNAERYIQTFDRFVAEVWTADGRNVSEYMREWLAT
jgi:endonuclease YncB( thermonuclease family)